MLCATLFISCQSKIEVKGYDAIKWKTSDLNCSDNRLSMAALLIENKEAILGKDQNQITDLLGAADQHELYSRNEKFFYYILLEQSCEDVDPQLLSIRFNSVGLVKEIMIIERANP